MSEIARFKDQKGVFEILNQTLIELDCQSLLSEALMFDMRAPLREYIDLLKLA